MAPLVSLFLHVRRATRAAAPLVCAACLGAGVAIAAATPLAAPYLLVGLALLVVIFVSRARRRARSIEAGVLLDLEIGALAMVGAFGVVLRLDGTLEGRTYPLIYV